MEVIGIQFFGSYEKAPWFLEDSPCRNRVKRAIFLTLVEIQTQARAQAYSGDYGVICISVLVRHDSNAWGIFVDEDVVGPLMRTI